MKRSNRYLNRNDSRRYSESISKHFNRSRIAQELENFFDSFDDDDDEHDFLLGIANGKERKNEGNESMVPAVVTPSSYSSTKNKAKIEEHGFINNKEEKENRRDNRLDHLMDPEFDPIKDRCDSDAFLLEAQGSQRKLRMQQWYAAESQLEKIKFTQREVPIANDLEEERFEIRNQVSLLLEDQEDQADDQDDSKQQMCKTSQDTDKVSSQTEEQDDTNLQASETIRKDAGDSSSPAEDQEEQNMEQGSMMDGFSVIEPSKPPQKQMHISYATSQFEEELPCLITLSMSESASNCEEATHSSKSNLSYAKSHLSYDETQTITPSIAFFLQSNKEIGNSSRTERLSPYSKPQLHRPHHDIISNLKSIDTSEDDESHTVMGFSRGSSKFTTDSPRILELRERKRVMERRMERITSKYPALIEIDKYSF